MRDFPVRTAAALVGVTLTLTLLAAAPAYAAPRTIRIEGHGYGHGRGMSQWGARGMAGDGASFHTILAHYYRGARLDWRSPGERIRVLVERANSIIVSSVRRFSINWAYGGSLGVNDARRRFVRVTFTGGHYVVDHAPTPAGPWRRFSRSRRNVVFVRGLSPLEIVAPRGSSRAYRGTIEIRARAGRLDAINHLPLEEYLMSVVPREVPSTWPREALRAQAIAARSYAVALIEEHRRRSYDICDSTACQVYAGLASRRDQGRPPVHHERASTTAAALETARTILSWRGRPALTEYSSSSGGHTASGSPPYLQAVPDPADRVSPHHDWKRYVDASVVERAWPEIGRLRSIQVRSRDGGGEWGGRVRAVRIAGSKRTIDVSGGTFASRLGLRSRWFNTYMSPPMYRFTVNLGIGAEGRAVRELQHRLGLNGVYDGPVTGYYGPLTRGGVQRYQRSRGIQATGYLGPITRGRLNAEAWP